jgi:hypothetical protein
VTPSKEKSIVSWQGKVYVMNREELNWLLQTIKDAETAERFVLAQYERGRISFQMVADVACEGGWINRLATRFSTRHSTEHATTELAMAIAC